MNKAQVQLAQKFFDKHLPGQNLGGLAIHAMRKHDEYLGIDSANATVLAQAMARSIFARTPKISKRAFYKEMLSGIKSLDELGYWFMEYAAVKKIREDNLRGPAAHFHVARYFHQTSGLGLPFSEQLLSFKLHSSIISRWLKRPPQKIGDFVVQYSTGLHAEAPLSLEISRNNKRIGSIGGYAYYEQEKPALRINNIQGVKLNAAGDPDYAERKQSHLAEYEKLSAQVGENWRTFFLNHLISFAHENGLTVVGELPKRYYLFGAMASDSEFKRQVRQYKQTYRKAGLKEHENKTWRL